MSCYVKIRGLFWCRRVPFFAPKKAKKVRINSPGMTSVAEWGMVARSSVFRGPSSGCGYGTLSCHRGCGVHRQPPGRAALEMGNQVAILDDLSTGAADNIERVTTHPQCELRVGSITDPVVLAEVMTGS